MITRQQWRILKSCAVDTPLEINLIRRKFFDLGKKYRRMSVPVPLL
jgi:hypothetical protein